MEKLIKYWNFHVKIHYDDDIIWAEVLDLPWCFTQAENEAELYNNLKEAISSYIMSLRKDFLNSNFDVRESLSKNSWVNA
jgi:predicted RNase H-like HicB family nuclease